MSRKKYCTAIWAMVIIFGMNFTFGSNLQVFKGFNLRSDKNFDNFQFLVAIWAMNVYFLKVLFFHSSRFKLEPTIRAIWTNCWKNYPKDYYFTPWCNLGYERNKNNDAIWAMVIIFGMNFAFGSNLQVFYRL